MQKKYMIIFILCGMLNADCIRDDKKEIVSCSENSIMWQDNKDVGQIELDWMNSIKYCENLIFSGYSDWRLPNRNELLSMVDYSKYDSSINFNFKNKSSTSYWTSTIDNGGFGGNFWVVNFYYGELSSFYPSQAMHVRCVRAGQ